jgi:hypothetical protein
MDVTAVRARFWTEVVSGVIGVVLLALTLVNPQWIELVFKVDPDEGSGALEVGISVVVLAIAVTSAFLARSEWRRARTS